MFQQDSALARVALNAANLFGAGNKAGIARLVGKTIIPYAKTPANVIDELVEFSLPPYALAKAGYAAKAGDYRKAKMLVGKALTGSTLIGVAKMLSDAGVIGGKPSDSEKQRDVQYQTLPPRTINITGLQRYAEGDSGELQPGDRVISLEKLGIVGGILSTVNAASEATATSESGFEVMSLLPETLSFAFNQSFLKGTNSLLSAMLDGEGAKLDKWISDYYGVIASIPFPNTLSAVSRSMRETMPDKIQIKDVEGEVAYDKITLGIYRLFKETEDGDVIPPKPGRNFTLEDATYRLTPDLYEEYARARGQANRKVAEALFPDPGFRRMTTADKVRALKAGYNQTSDIVREAFIAKNGRRIRLGERQ